MNLTNNELAVLRAIDNSDYGDRLTDGVWFFSVADAMQADGPRGLALAGTVSSLVQKGAVWVDGKGNDSTIGITAAGVAAYLAAVVCPNKDWQ